VEITEVISVISLDTLETNCFAGGRELSCNCKLVRRFPISLYASALYWSNSISESVRCNPPDMIVVLSLGVKAGLGSVRDSIMINDSEAAFLLPARYAKSIQQTTSIG
jgi:hypothetical protein